MVLTCGKIVDGNADVRSTIPLEDPPITISPPSNAEDYDSNLRSPPLQYMESSDSQ